MTKLKEMKLQEAFTTGRVDRSDNCLIPEKIDYSDNCLIPEKIDYSDNCLIPTDYSDNLDDSCEDFDEIDDFDEADFYEIE